MIEEKVQIDPLPVDKHSLRTRYLHKLAANILGFGANLVIAAITPRGLGPKSYGDYSFLTNFFLEVKTFFDGGVSVGFYNKLSHRQNEEGLISFYLRFLIFASTIILGLVALAQLSGIYPKLWPAQKIQFVYMGVLAVILTWFSQAFDYFVDAFGLTVYSERARMLQKVAGLLLLVFLFVFHILNLGSYFLYQYFNYLLLMGMFFWIIKVRRHSLLRSWGLPIAKIKKYINEFYHYSFPLFIYSVVSLITGVLDRWLLQVFGGSIQQGFFGLSYHIGVMCFLFTSAMTPLIMRDYAIAYADKNMQRIAGIFRRYVPMLYAVAAYFACFIAINSNKVVFILGGNEYKSAELAVRIMAFYPIHQTYGQLSSSLLLSVGKTKLYRNIGIFLSLSGLVTSYFLLAPYSLKGFNLGATGLAIKMVIINIIGVNCILYFNCRFLKIKFWKYICHQALPIICFVLAALLSAFISGSILKLKGHVIIDILVSGCLYTFMAAIITFYFPVIFGLENRHIKAALGYITNHFCKKKN